MIVQTVDDGNERLAEAIDQVLATVNEVRDHQVAAGTWPDARLQNAETEIHEMARYLSGQKKLIRSVLVATEKSKNSKYVPAYIRKHNNDFLSDELARELYKIGITIDQLQKVTSDGVKLTDTIAASIIKLVEVKVPPQTGSD